MSIGSGYPSGRIVVAAWLHSRAYDRQVLRPVPSAANSYSHAMGLPLSGDCDSAYGDAARSRHRGSNNGAWLAGWWPENTSLALRLPITVAPRNYRLHNLLAHLSGKQR